MPQSQIFFCISDTFNWRAFHPKALVLLRPSPCRHNKKKDSNNVINIKTIQTPTSPEYNIKTIHSQLLLHLLLLLLPLALQPTVGFGLSNNVLPFFPICHQLFYLLTPSTWKSLSTSSFYLFLGLPLLLVPSSSWVKIFLGILSSSILSRWPNQLILCPFIHFTIFSPLLISSSSRFVRLFHSRFSYLGPYFLLNIVLFKN